MELQGNRCVHLEKDAVVCASMERLLNQQIASSDRPFDASKKIEFHMFS